MVSGKDGFEGQVRIQVVFLKPREVKQLGLIFQTGVAKEGDDGLPRAALAGETHGAGEVDAGGKAEEQAFLAQLLIHDGERGLVGKPVVWPAPGNSIQSISTQARTTAGKPLAGAGEIP